MKSITLITTALIVSGSFLSVADAVPSSDVPTAVVKFRDLDTTRSAGKEKLYRRLLQAARAVCSPVDPNGYVVKPLLTPTYVTCIEQAVSVPLRDLIGLNSPTMSPPRRQRRSMLGYI